VLVASTDGVGTKLKVAVEAKKFDTIGIDLVAMSVNDLLVTGAKPLFFLDYISTGKLNPETLLNVVSGITVGCREAGIALIGGETAEMPGMYADGDFDLAGFAVGVVEKDKILGKDRVDLGDSIVGITSSGFHSNGYSLLRNLFFNRLGFSITDTIPCYGPISELLLTPTKIYSSVVQATLDSDIEIHSMVHITGGGFYDNIPRAIKDNQCAKIFKSNIKEPPAIRALREYSDIVENELYRVFNMGIGYIMIVPPQCACSLINLAAQYGQTAAVIGEIVEGCGVHIV
jgi:phosphoribosylformylglycinamidine cyclo-ligase